MNRALLLVVALATGCASADEEPPHFTDIDVEVLRPSCTFACHSGGEFAAGGLDLQVDAYAELVGRAPTAMQCLESPMQRVVAGDPEQSLLYVKVIAKIDGSIPPCGDSMPLGANKAALSGDQAEMIRAWIAAGAPQ
jgi:hypothetical protein